MPPSKADGTGNTVEFLELQEHCVGRDLSGGVVVPHVVEPGVLAVDGPRPVLVLLVVSRGMEADFSVAAVAQRPLKVRLACRKGFLHDTNNNEHTTFILFG